MDVDRSDPLHTGQQKMSDIIESFPNDLDLPANVGITCPAATTQDAASKVFFAAPSTRLKRSTAGSGFTQGWEALISTDRVPNQLRFDTGST